MQINLMEKVANLSNIVQVNDGYARNFSLHTDVLVDVTVSVDKLTGSGGFPDGHMALLERGKMKALLVGALGLIVIGQLLLGIAPHTMVWGRGSV